MAARLQAQGAALLADPETTQMGAHRHARNRLPGHLLLRLAQNTRQRQKGDRPRTRQDVRQARHTARRAHGACRSGRRRRYGLRFRQNHVQGKTLAARHNILLHKRSRQEPPRARKAIPRHGGALPRQLLCCPQQRRVQRRLLCIYTQRRALSHGTLYIFPYQRPRYGTVRTHANRVRRRRIRVLPRGLHRTHARREPAARRHCRDNRKRKGRSKIRSTPWP